MKDKILVVEDDPEISYIVRETLLRCDYEVNWASTGIEGLEDFKNDNYQMVIIDLMLPEMDGFTLCKNLRNISDIPLLIISAKNSDLDKVKALELGADDYLTKPFSLVELKARVFSHMRRYRRYENKNIDNMHIFRGGLVADEDKHLVSLESGSLSLTAKEYELLLLLIHNPKRAFSKKEIYENIWGQEDVDGNNTVTVHVKQLRNKLKDNLKNPKYIQTVWGVGYRFIGELLP